MSVAPSVINRMPWSTVEDRNAEVLLGREWLVTNGLGGYASGTVSGASTRRYHGLLIAALPAPFGRMVMFNHLYEEARLPDGSVTQLGGVEHPDEVRLAGERSLDEFRLEAGLPAWRFRFGDFVLEKRIFMPHQRNTVVIDYKLVAGKGSLRLRLRPNLHFRPHEHHVGAGAGRTYAVRSVDREVTISAPELPPLHMRMVADSQALVLDGGSWHEVIYRIERQRGYEGRGTLWSPGYFRTNLEEGQSATLIASTEELGDLLLLNPEDARAAELERRNQLLKMAHPCAREGMGAELVLAADQFIITPESRARQERVHLDHDVEPRTIIAGYHWFTDWGRDTMISLEGLTLTTGRSKEANWILQTFAHYVRDGLIPNLFPEGERDGLYHTADATLWFFHAAKRYVDVTGDHKILVTLLPIFRDIIEHHLRGTHFGIGVDPNDGLLKQGAPGYQLTWMDAKVDDWVVTPRRGKAVEINALWYNAVRLLEGWYREEGDVQLACELRKTADRARASFNKRFWNAAKGCLFDVVDGENGDDPSIRPNQVFAIALEHPVLDEMYWRPVMDVVADRLLTPVGLRSLAPGEPDYKPQYYGDLRARDAAYHQGTVWAWLIGPFIDAWLKVYPDRSDMARAAIEGFRDHLSEACIGSISEIFDAEAPYTPRGCVAQAWSVAEVLRCWVKTCQLPPSEHGK